MAQGENLDGKTIYAILSLASDQKEHGSSEFVKALDGKFAKNTVYKYLRKTVADGLMEVKLGSSKESFKPKYLITERGLEEWNKTMMKITVGEWIDKMSGMESKEWLHRSVEEILRLQEMVRNQERDVQKGRDLTIRYWKTLKKIVELSEKRELEGFSAAKYMEDLKNE